MRFKSKKIISAMLIVLALVSTNVTQSFAARRVLSVPQYSQFSNNGGNMLCWATAGSMLVSYYKGDNVNRNVSIAKYIHGNTNYNKPGDLSQTAKGIRRYVNLTFSTAGKLSYSGVQKEINNNHPTIVRHGGSGVGHMVILKGYDTSGSSVLYNDPWTGKGHAASHSYFSNSMPNGPWSHSLMVIG